MLNLPPSGKPSAIGDSVPGIEPPASAAGEPLRSAGDFLRYLEEHHPGTVLRIDRQVDPKACEHAAFEEYLAQRQRHPWLIFEDVVTVAGGRWPGLFSTYCASDVRRLALAYGLDLATQRVDDLIVRHLETMRQPAQPQYLPATEAPVKQVRWLGEAARLDHLPFFRNCERDSGVGWFTPIWLTRELDSGRYNVSWHRGQYLDPKHSTIWFFPGRHVWEICQQYRRAGKPVPAVGVIGHHPAFEHAAGSDFPSTEDELAAVAGCYQRATGGPLRVTASETWGDDLLVPADAEVIVEGYILDRQEWAGTWGDYWLVYAPGAQMSVFEVTAITMRERPIFTSVWPATEADYNIHQAASVLGELQRHFPTVRSVHCPFAQTVVVSFQQRRAGEAVHLAASLLSFGMGLKTIIVVDEDVDPSDTDQLFFALTTRVDATRDVHVLPTIRHVCNPVGEGSTVGGMLIDATKPIGDDRYDIGKPPKALVEQVGQLIPDDVVDKLISGPRHRW